MLVTGLSQQSRTFEEDRPTWTNELEILARIVEEVSLGTQVVALTLGQKKRNLPRLHEVEHPERQQIREEQKQASRPEVETDPKAIRAFFERW